MTDEDEAFRRRAGQAQDSTEGGAEFANTKEGDAAVKLAEESQVEQAVQMMA